MSGNQIVQFLERLEAIQEMGRGALLIVINNGHVRWFLAGQLEDFELPDGYTRNGSQKFRP